MSHSQWQEASGLFDWLARSIAIGVVQHFLRSYYLLNASCFVTKIVPETVDANVGFGQQKPYNEQSEDK